MTALLQAAIGRGYRDADFLSLHSDRPPPLEAPRMEDLDGGFGIQMFGHVASRHAVHGGEHVRSTVDYVREGRKNNFEDSEKHDSE